MRESKTTDRGRGSSPNDITVRMLCGVAAGRCEFKGCQESFFCDKVTLANLNNAFVAHIIASSAKGPRGDEGLSHQLSEKLDNLMLMCHTHHKLVDDNPEVYPAEVLQDMKRSHEERIERIHGMMEATETELVLLSSPIKGKSKVMIDERATKRAVLVERQIASSYAHRIFVDSAFEYRTSNYWVDLSSKLQSNYNTTVLSLMAQNPNAHLSVFPIAPIPLIIKFGEMLGEKIPIDIYQKTRTPNTWEWLSTEQTNSFEIMMERRKSGSSVALILSLTASVAVERVLEIADYDNVYIIKASQNDTDSIKSRLDLSCFWHQYQTVCDVILNTLGRDVTIDLFPAIPVSAAFEVGRRYMPRAYPPIRIFDEDNGFFETITIGG